MTLYKTMTGIGVLGAVLLALSYVFQHDEHGAGWVLGGIGWFGFWACVLALIVLSLAALVRGARRRDAHA